MILCAVICPSPPLLARELTGAGSVLPELRKACADATAALLRDRPDLVAVVGAGERTRTWDDDLRLDLGGYAPGLGPAGVALSAAAAPGRERQSAELPLGPGLGGRLLDEAGYTGSRVVWSVGHDEPPGRCAELGARIARSADRVALLAMADGSARRGPEAPGYLDERSGPFDAEVARAVRDADTDALLGVDPGLARELLADGRPCWQVLAGALHGTQPATEISYCDDPFGVAYLVASLAVQPQQA